MPWLRLLLPFFRRNSPPPFATRMPHWFICVWYMLFSIIDHIITCINSLILLAFSVSIFCIFFLKIIYFPSWPSSYCDAGLIHYCRHEAMWNISCVFAFANRDSIERHNPAMKRNKSARTWSTHRFYHRAKAIMTKTSSPYPALLKVQFLKLGCGLFKNFKSPETDESDEWKVKTAGAKLLRMQAQKGRSTFFSSAPGGFICFTSIMGEQIKTLPNLRCMWFSIWQRQCQIIAAPTNKANPHITISVFKRLAITF